jgi:hypothetical protein
VADYSILFARSARKELQGLDSPIASRLLKRIESLDSSGWASHCTIGTSLNPRFGTAATVGISGLGIGLTTDRAIASS